MSALCSKDDEVDGDILNLLEEYFKNLKEENDKLIHNK